MKKFLSLVLALVMTMSLVTVSAGAKDFTDSSKITYDEAVAVMSAAKVIDGYAEGDFRPTNTLTRGAAAKIICNLILGPTTASALVADAAPYKDVPTNHTFAGYIAYCQKEGIISGYADGTFKPANSLTGYAFMKMLLGALGYDSAIEGYTGANWSIAVAKQAINAGLNKGLKGDFNGVKAVNREEACLYAFNTLKATMVEYDTTITIGGVNVKDMPLSQLSEYVSFVTQDNFLFRCSLLENIRLGNPSATDEEVKAAARAAQCEEFISKLPQGYDTPAGEAGKRLSGGEKQRIAIARMMLKNAPIVILDEATAFTDPENEDLIQQAISALTRGKTIITIAHRLSTVKNADQILVVDDGRIAQHGTHDQLVKQEGLYRRFTAIRQQAEGWRIAAE